MSTSAEAEQRRREALKALKSRQGKAPASSGPSRFQSFHSTTNGQGHSSAHSSSNPLRSPESVLVPSSSSPVAPTPKHTTSKFFGGGRTTTNGNGTNGSTIPSSKLGGHTGGGMGTPQSVISSMLSRKSGQDSPRDDNHHSLSYETSGRKTYADPDQSPNSPQPLSRLKKKYDESPTATGSSAHVPPQPPSPSRSGSRTPSLIQAARALHSKETFPSAEEEAMVARISAQFSNVRRDTIRQIIRKHGQDYDAAIIEAKQESDRLPNRSTSSHRSSVSSPSLSSGGPSKPDTLSSYQYSRPSSSSAYSRPQPPPVPSPKAPAKPRKNENSRIYANRDKGDKRRDPDDSESEAEAASDADSDEMSWSGDEGHRRKRKRGDEDELDAEGEALKAFNEVDEAMLTGTIACSAEQAAKIISLRPYEDTDDVYTKLNKARGVSYKLFEQYTEIMEGYVQIDSCLNRCENIATDVANTLSVWRGASMINDSVVGTPRSDGMNDVKVDVGKVAEILRQETDMRKRKILSQYVQSQPESMGEGTVLKDYQLLGLNWLNLLYSKRIGCILADEMGLGKTIQVISFLCHLKERKIKGPHMIFVPASTLENWIREFDRFGPDIDVQTYYGTQSERAGLRDDLKRQFRKGRLEVVLASYTQVAAPDDLSFFRKKIQFETCIYDEGHRLKSCTTKAYSDLMSIKPRWRLLLTGTPLQNNLQELVSLLMFIHKDVFTDAEPYLRAIFKSQGHANLLSSQRVSRARKMLTPFVLRRRKAHVLDLPPKIETVEHCDMTGVQSKLYRQTLQRSKKLLQEMDDTTLEEAANAVDSEAANGSLANGKSKGKAKVEEKKKGAFASSSSNILMDLRKAASHPLLFRRLYTDAKLKTIARACLNTPRWCDSNFDYVVEDLEIMSDAEIHRFCETSEYDTIKKFALPHQAFLEGGKVSALQKHIERCKVDGKKMLVFSQFVMILDILEVALQHLDVKYVRLDGSTKTDQRQEIVDEFTDDPDITVFLLSTKAGGVGINLVAASVVIIYDQDFNPHNDRQAADRAYRIGQERDVEVVKLISKDSIDEDMLAIGTTKLQLDDAVGGEEITLDGEAAGPGQKEDKTAKEVKKSLLTTLRNKFDSKGGTAGASGKDGETEAGIKSDPATEDGDIDMSEGKDIGTTPKKVARGGPATQVQ